MSKVQQKLELVANILIIVVALLLVGVLVQKSFFASAPAAADQPRLQPKIGTVMNVPDANWSQQTKTLILALQAGCRFCTESAPFYKRVIESVKDKNVKLIAVFPTEIEESAAYLQKLGLNGMEVKQSSLKDLQTSGTPTLILTDNKGEVTNYWVGRLSPEKEIEVLNQLNL